MIDRNQIPPSWKIVKLGEVCTFSKGKMPQILKKEESKGCSIPYINIKAFEKGIFAEYTDGVKCNLCDDEDLLMVWDGARCGLIGKAKKGAVGSTLMKILPTENIHKEYLYHFISSRFQTLNTKPKGVGIPHIEPTLLWNFELVVPPLPEQHRIVSKIEELFSELDKGIESLKTAQQQLKVYRQAVLKWAFEGRLTEEWRSENSHLNNAYDFLKQVSEIRKKNFLEAEKNGIKRIEKNYDFEFRRCEEINTWANATLNKLIYIAGRIGWRGLTKDEYTTEGPLFLSVHSLNYGKYVEFKDAYHISEERYLESPEIILKDKDILLCKDGAGIGKIGIINKLPSEATVNSSLLVIRGMEIFIPEFLYHLLSGPKLQSIVRKRITGSATPHLFQNDIRKFELLIPPLEEQQQIVQEIETRFSVCDKLEETITTALQQSEALRQSILKKAFEGKLVEQNPKDESAAKLLERIKAEKAAEQRNVYRKGIPSTKQRSVGAK